MPEGATRALWGDFRIPVGVYAGTVDGEHMRVQFHVVESGRLAGACVLKIHTEGRWRAFATMYVHDEIGRPFMSMWPSWGPSLLSERNAALIFFQYVCWRFEPTVFDDVRDQGYHVEIEDMPYERDNRQQLLAGPRYERDVLGRVSIDSYGNPVLARPRWPVSASPAPDLENLDQAQLDGLGRILQSDTERTRRIAAINAIRGRWHPGQQHLTPSETQISREISRQRRVQEAMVAERDRTAREQDDRVNRLAEVSARTRRRRTIRPVAAHSFFNSEEIR